MIRRMILAAAALLMASTAQAQSLAWNDDERVSSFSAQDLVALAEFMGHEVVSNAGTNPMLISARTPQGMTYGMLLTSCTDGKDCNGIRLQALYPISAGMSDEKFNDVNKRYLTITAIHDRSSGRFALNRYVILDFGVTRKNIRANLAAFLRTVPAALKILSGDG